jgi:arsenate reductase (glutaredoxin)
LLERLTSDKSIEGAAGPRLLQYINLAGMDVQIFGVKKSAETRKALRFFAERRTRTHFVDLQERAASRGELTRFAQKFGVQALIDEDSRRYAELGLRTARYGDARWMEILVDEPLLLKMPLVRHGHALTIGAAEATWKSWLAT